MISGGNLALAAVGFEEHFAPKALAFAAGRAAEKSSLVREEAASSPTPDPNRADWDRTASRNLNQIADDLSELEKAYRQELERMRTSAYLHDDSVLILVAAVASAGLLLSLGFGWTQGRAIQQLSATVQNLRGSLHRLEAALAEREEPEPLAEIKPPRTPSAKVAATSETPPAVLVVQSQDTAPAEPPAKTEPQIPVSPSGNGSSLEPQRPAPSKASASDPCPPVPALDNATRLELLLGKGQTLALLSQKQSALECYSEAAILAPNNPEVLVKKGKLLEQMERFDQAIECYDRAIAAESTNVTAYLLKAGALNRLERYAEALNCYDLALRSRHQSLAG